MNKPLVSVIIPNYNYAKYIAKAIDSVLAQTYDNLEVIVVDDESKDESLFVLESFSERITVISQKNQGVSRARNNGAEQSEGEFLSFLDADDVWLPTKIERQMEKFAGDSQLGMVHCSMTCIDQDGTTGSELTDGMEGFVADDLLRFEKGVVIGIGSTGLVPKTVFDKLGGFDERMSTAADWDLSYRVAAEYQIGFVREALVQYRIHNSNMHGNIGAMEHDMFLGFEKAFAGGAKKSRIAYGNLYKTLAGSYFRAGDYRAFVRTAITSLKYNPGNLSYFAQFPLRRMRARTN